jgi:multicomponent Na+:H+ antiporter subunit F
VTAAVLALLAVVVVAGVLRALRPGTLADRVIGLDVALLGLIGLIAVDAASSGRRDLLDVAPVLGLLAVVGTLAVARVAGDPRRSR